MYPYSTGDKVKLSATILVTRALFVAAVLVVSLLPGVSLLVALVIVAASAAAYSVVPVWLPASRRRRRAGGAPMEPSGDRFPRRPLPFRPSMGAERPLPAD